MMKSFFKKLAFVMALAMVVSMAAPAAQKAVAAEDKKPLAVAYQKGAVITALNLVEVGDTEDLRFVYAPANWKDLEVKWSSSNENVVSVDANGVVEAKAAGTATISVAVGTETASIEVYSVDTQTFVATMGNAEDRAMTELTLTVGEEFDFAFYGIKDYSVDLYRCEWWPVGAEDIITLDEKGLVTAVGAGTAKVTLAVMNLKTGIKTDVAPCVVTVEEEKPAVDPNNFEVTKMISDSKFELTFENTEVTDAEIKNNLKVYYYATGDVRVNYNSVKSVSVKDGVATVEFYYVVGDGVKYVFAMNGIEKEYTTYIGKPASMKITWKDEKTGVAAAWAGYTSLFSPVILNDRGTDITASVLNTNLGKVVEYSLVDAPATAQYWLNGLNGIYFAQPYETAVVKAVFWDGYDSNGVRINACECTTPITSTEKPLYDFPYQTPVAATVHGDWNNNVNTKFAVGDDLVVNFAEANGQEFIWLKLKDSNGKEQVVECNAYGNGLERTSEDYQKGYITGRFSFVSDNMNIFTVGATGEVKANAAGTANILVYYDPNVNNYTTADQHLVAVVPVTCYGVRTVTNVSIDKNFATISTEPGNNANTFNAVEFTVTLTDQLGDKIDSGNLPLTCVKLSTQGTGMPEVTDSGLAWAEKGVYKITFTATDPYNVLAEGATRQVSYAVQLNGATKQTLSINVVDPVTSGNLDASAYNVKLNATKTDIKTANGLVQSFAAKLIAQKNGVDFEQLTFAGKVSDVANNIASARLNGYYVKVLKDGVDVTAKIAPVADGDFTVTVPLSATKSATVGALNITVSDKTLGAGNYTVEVYKAVSYKNATVPSALSYIARNTITITDGEPTVAYLAKKSHTVSSFVDVNTMAQEVFEVKIGNTTYKNGEWGAAIVDGTDSVWINTHTVFYRSITVYVPVAGSYVPYKIPVNDYVSVQ